MDQRELLFSIFCSPFLVFCCLQSAFIDIPLSMLPISFHFARLPSDTAQFPLLLSQPLLTGPYGYLVGFVLLHDPTTFPTPFCPHNHTNVTVLSRLPTNLPTPDAASSPHQIPHIIQATGPTMQHLVPRNHIPSNRELRYQRRLPARELGNMSGDRNVSLIDNEEDAQGTGLDVYLVFAGGEGNMDQALQDHRVSFLCPLVWEPDICVGRKRGSVLDR